MGSDYKLLEGEMDFLSFKLQAGWLERKKITFIDNGKATPFRPSLGFGPFRNTFLEVEGETLYGQLFDEKLLFF